jgi:hypothetical protein
MLCQMKKTQANQRVERTGGSRLAHLQFERQRRLPPVAHADRRRCYAMTRLEAIRAIAVTVAVASLLLFVFRYAVEASSITIRGAWARPFFYHGDWLGRVMSCGTWLLTALLIYVSAPVANRLPGVRDGGVTVHSFAAVRERA